MVWAEPGFLLTLVLPPSASWFLAAGLAGELPICCKEVFFLQQVYNYYLFILVLVVVFVRKIVPKVRVFVVVLLVVVLVVVGFSCRGLLGGLLFSGALPLCFCLKGLRNCI